MLLKIMQFDLIMGGVSWRTQSSFKLLFYFGLLSLHVSFLILDCFDLNLLMIATVLTQRASVRRNARLFVIDCHKRLNAPSLIHQLSVQFDVACRIADVTREKNLHCEFAWQRNKRIVLAAGG